MAITISIDNDRLTGGVQKLHHDESDGVQTPATTDDGDELDILLSALVGGNLSGFLGSFNTFLNGTLLNGFVLSDLQKQFAANKNGASSSSDFVNVTTSAGETISDLFFSDSTGGALAGDQVAGMQTLDGQNVYLWSNGNFCERHIAWPPPAPLPAKGGLSLPSISTMAVDHKTAQIQMLAFEPLKHPIGSDPDDASNFTDVLRVGAAATISFNFDHWIPDPPCGRP